MVTKLIPDQDFAVSLAPQMNLLVNPGFEVWQRGTSFANPVNAAYTADQWKMNRDASGIVAVTREPSIIDRGSYSLKFDVTNNGGGGLNHSIMQAVENAIDFRGKTVTLTIRVKSPSSSFCVYVQDSSGVGTPTYHSGSNNWETLTVTRTIASNTTILLIVVGFGVSATVVSTSYIDSAMLVVGSTPIAFIPMHPADDLARCLRYYQFGGGGNSLDFFTMNRDALHNYFIYGKQFFVPMAAVPVVTLGIIQIYLIQDAIQGTAALAADQANWTTANDGVDTRVFNYQAIRSTANSTYSNAQAQIGWTAEVA